MQKAHLFIMYMDLAHLVSVPACCVSQQAGQIPSGLLFNYFPRTATPPHTAPLSRFTGEVGFVFRWKGFCPTQGNCGAYVRHAKTIFSHSNLVFLSFFSSKSNASVVRITWKLLSRKTHQQLPQCFWINTGTVW